MNTLGAVGIDPITIVAQILDFLILVYFLNKYLYKPVSDEIEKNETELASANVEMKKLQIEKEQLQKDKAALLLSSQKKSRDILTEAQELAEKIKKDATAEAKEKAYSIIYEVKKQMEEKETEIRREMRSEERERVKHNAKK